MLLLFRRTTACLLLFSVIVRCLVLLIYISVCLLVHTWLSSILVAIIPHPDRAGSQIPKYMMEFLSVWALEFLSHGSVYTHMAGLRIHFLVAEHGSYSVTLCKLIAIRQVDRWVLVTGSCGLVLFSMALYLMSIICWYRSLDSNARSEGFRLLALYEF